MDRPRQTQPDPTTDRPPRKLVPVQLATLQPHRSYEFDLYLRNEGEYALYRARHTNELVRREEVILNLDYRQSGLGGASCGPGCLPQYLVPPVATRFSVRLRPFRESPADGAGHG